MTGRDILEIAARNALTYEVKLREDDRVHGYLFNLVPLGDSFIVQHPNELYRPYATWDAAPACEAVLAAHRAHVVTIQAVTNEQYEVVWHGHGGPLRKLFDVGQELDNLSAPPSGADSSLARAAVTALHRARFALRESTYP